MTKRIALALLALLWLTPAHALQADPPLPNPAQEARAQTLFHAIRCVVCQSEAIADSPADVARDMRRLIRERIQSGDSDAAITSYLASRYGDIILMNPPLKRATWALWFAPPALLLIGALIAARLFRRKPA